MSIYCRQFKASDLTAFVPLEPMDADMMDDPKFAQAIEDSGLAVTGVRDGVVIGCGGVHPLEDREGEGEMWLRLSEYSRQHPFEALHWLREGMKIIEETYPFYLLYATANCCFKSGIKLIRHLGFSEVEQKEHGGKDWIIYSKRIA